MAATLIPSLFSFSFSSSNSNPPPPSSSHYYYCCRSAELQHPRMSSILFFLIASLFSFSILIFSLYTRALKNRDSIINSSSSSSPLSTIPTNTLDKQQQTHESNLTHSLLLEILPSNSPKWATLFTDDNPVLNGSALDKVVDSGGEECCGKKKKKKRAKKKTPNSPTHISNSQEQENNKSAGTATGNGMKPKVGLGLGAKEKQELACLYPFTSSSSATQRKIKQQYDQLVKSHESNGLTLAQVGQFVNCLIEARNELQHKSEVIQRKFTITKALLFKADRSSFDRLRQQIYKLELEQKRLEEDAFVYNWLQQELKLSPAYKKMLEIGACMELKEKSGKLVESTDTDLDDISFEELLAQEKKDSFWQRNGKPRSCLG
ncbi:hypothetical protein LguiB_023289 [Lonicera macranthoides]